MLAAAFLAAPAYATSVTVVLTGEWSQVTDNANVTNGSITVGGAFTVTLTYDDATSDIDPDPASGGYLLPGATSSLELESGSYTFTLLASEGIIFGIGDNLNGQDDFGWFAENYTTVGPLPVGITTGYGYTNPFVTDQTQLAHASDALTDLPWDVEPYDDTNLGMYFLIAVEGAGANKHIELVGDFTEFTVLPEPSILTLAMLGTSALVGFLRRG
jgi:hypothetical protein